MTFQLWKPHQFGDSIKSIKKLSVSNNLTIIHLELLCDTGTNCFVANNPNYLHDLIPSYVTLGITRGSNDSIYFKGTFHFCLHYEEAVIIMRIKDSPRAKSNPHNSFPQALFKDFVFKQAIHFVREKIILKDPEGEQHILLIDSQ